jgi:hypothetical protein
VFTRIAPEYLALDEVNFSFSQIKQILDLGEWFQEAEDSYGGVDGMRVTDHKALFEPREFDRLKDRLNDLTKEKNKRGGDMLRKPIEWLCRG